MDYKLCKCLHYGYCIFPSRSVFDLLVLPTNWWWTQADKKHLTCEDVIQWILVWTINFTFMHLICQGYKPGKNMEFGHCWYTKSVFCNILQIWILYTYMYYRVHAGQRFLLHLGVKPIIHQSELRTYTKVVLFKENSSFRFVVL